MAVQLGFLLNSSLTKMELLPFLGWNFLTRTILLWLFRLTLSINSRFSFIIRFLYLSSFVYERLYSSSRGVQVMCSAQSLKSTGDKELLVKRLVKNFMATLKGKEGTEALIESKIGPKLGSDGAAAQIRRFYAE